MGRKPKTKKPPAFCIINNFGKHQIQGSFYGLIIKLSGSAQEAKLIFFRSKNARNPVRWIREGIEKGYAFNRVIDEFDNIPYVKGWIDNTINRFRYKPEPKRIGSQKITKIGSVLSEITKSL